MSQIRVKDAAHYLGVSADTVRRWAEDGTLTSTKSSTGVTMLDGLELAHLARQRAVLPEDPSGMESSARNRFVGLVTRVVTDKVMAQVELQCGPHRVVSLMSAEAVKELALEPGSVAVAVVKSTTVIVETPGRRI
ncbi:TOBE domain-containing protein [Arthrobacter sp. CAL618]|uniref:TOBE domain-containing protein n=1 Tax=Arthrobacter sp. CAL618 TaxID=1055770 RepID=UPI000409D10D|nr:TOBE domain-containing protein [Arthrobacter sp. CAL618]